MNKKELQENVENNFVLGMRLQEVMRIVMEHKLTVYRTDDKWVNANWVCIWCRTSLYIGRRYKDVPEDLRAYFISPQQYGEYMQLCKNFIEGSLR